MARDRYRTKPAFLDVTVVAGDPRDQYHPLILPLHVWKKWFNRVKTWRVRVNGSGFNPPWSNAAQHGSESLGTPAAELDVLTGQKHAVAGERSHWLCSMSLADSPGFADAQFYLYSAKAQTNGSPFFLDAMRWSADGLGVAASLIFKLQSSGEGVSFTLYSTPSDAPGPYVTDLIIDPLGDAIALPLYGVDSNALSAIELAPIEYWTFRGIYDPLTGEKNPGQSVFSNAYRP